MNKSRGFLLYLMILAVISLNTAVVWATESYQYVTKLGAYGEADGEFFYPNGVAVDASGNVYVVDTDLDRVQKFSSTGTYLTQWGVNGSGNGEFDAPTGIAVDASGNQQNIVLILPASAHRHSRDISVCYLRSRI